MVNKLSFSKSFFGLIFSASLLLSSCDFAVESLNDENITVTAAREPEVQSTTEIVSTTVPSADENAELIQTLFDEQQSDVWVSGEGVVTKLLADDNDGSRHQKFILELSTGQTLLISHNIDIAPRLDDIQKGDTVEFKGEYIYNEQGGLVHWTHHDPDGDSEGGFLKLNGEVFS